jgi:hypothetical protein
MGMSSYVYGLRDANDPQYKKMAAALKACLAADLPLPKPLQEYFKGSHDPEEALQVEIKSEEGSKDSTNYYDVVLADLPPDVKVIRFCNSW